MKNVIEDDFQTVHIEGGEVFEQELNPEEEQQDRKNQQKLNLYFDSGYDDSKGSYVANIIRQSIISPQLIEIRKKKFSHTSPLDEIEREELGENFINAKNELGLQAAAQKYEFPLASYQPQYNKDYLQLVQFSYPSQINQPLYKKEITKLGRIKCIASSQNSIAIGGILGNIFFQNVRTNVYEVFMLESQGSITCIDVSMNDQIMTVGYQNGNLGIFDLVKKTMIQVFNEVHSGSLITCKILSSQGNDPQKLVTISSDDSGTTRLTRYNKSFFKLCAEANMLVPPQKYPVQNIQVLNNQLMEKFLPKDMINLNIVAISSICKIWILLIDLAKPQVSTLFSQNDSQFFDNQNQFFFSSLSWGQGFLKITQQQPQDFTSPLSQRNTLIDATKLSEESRKSSNSTTSTINQSRNSFTSTLSGIVNSLTGSTINNPINNTTNINSNNNVINGNSFVNNNFNGNTSDVSQNLKNSAIKGSFNSNPKEEKDEKGKSKVPNQSPSSTNPTPTKPSSILVSSLMISFSWNEIIYIGVIKITEEESNILGEQKEVKLSLQLSKKIQSPQNVIVSSFITPSVLFAIDINKTVFVFNTTELDKIFQIENEVNNIKKLIFQIKDDLMVQTFAIKNDKIVQKSDQFRVQNASEGLYTKDMLNVIKAINFQLFHNSFSLSRHDCQLYFLSENTLGIAGITSWEIIISNMMEKDELLLAMHFLMQIYSGHYQFATNLSGEQQERREQLEMYVKLISSKFVKICLSKLSEDPSALAAIDSMSTNSFLNSSGQNEGMKKSLIQKGDDQVTLSMIDTQRYSRLFKGGSILEKDQKQQLYENFIIIVIEFLISMDTIEHLFGQIMEILRGNQPNCLNRFFKSLEPFILLNKIRKVPNPALVEIIYFLKESQNLQLAQHFMLAIDLNNVDVSPLIAVCLETGLIHSLLYLCTKGSESEIISPLSKLWSLYQKQREEGKHNQAVKCAMRALWYIRLCLKEDLINGQKIDKDKYISIVQHLGQWTFHQPYLTENFKINPQALFEVLILFFEEKQAFIINACDNININVQDFKKDWISFDHRRKVTDEALGLIFTSFQLAMESLDPHTTPQTKILQANAQQTLFLARIMQLGKFRIARSKIIQTANFLIRYPKVLESLNFDIEAIKSELDPLPPGITLEQITINIYAKELAHSNFIINLLEMGKLGMTSEEYNQITDSASVSQFSAVGIYVNEHNSNYGKCFEIYMNTSNWYIKNKVFSWLFRSLTYLENQKKEKQFNELIESIVQRLTELLQISTELTRDLICRFHKNAEFSIVMKLEDDPDLQIDYIQKVLKEREQGVTIDSEILKLHLQLLCKNYPERVLVELETYAYPLDDSILICRQYGNKQGQAYLQERSGNTEQAMKLHFVLLESVIKVFRKYLSKRDYSNLKEKEAELEKSMFDRMNVILKICRNHFKHEQDHSQWFLFLDKIIAIRSQIVKRADRVYNFLNAKLIEVVGQIIEDVSQTIPVETFTEVLKQKYAGMNFVELSMTFKKIIFNFAYTKHILDSAVDWIKESYDCDQRTLYRDLRKGIYTSYECGNCELDIKNVQDQKFFIFNCGHIYHKICLSVIQDEPVCSQCFKIDQILIMLVNNLQMKSEKLAAKLNLTNNVIIDENQPNQSIFFNRKSIFKNKQQTTDQEQVPKSAKILQAFADFDKTSQNEQKDLYRFVDQSDYLKQQIN